MYHQPSPRKLLIQRTVTYSFMSVAVIALVTVLVFIMLGYQFNGDDGKIEQGGLTQFDSRPTGADVTIDGTSFGTRTPSKTTMTSGQHFVTIGRSGYNTWQKSVKVTAGSVLWLNYTRLIPNKLTPASVADFATVSSTAASPDMKWMAIKDDAATPDLHLAELSKDSVKMTKLILPDDSYTHPTEGKTQSFSIEKWDPDSRYVLVKHTYDDSELEWMVVDSQDITKTKNVTKLLDIAASKLVFDGGNSHIMYAQIGSDVRKVDLNAATLSRPLVSNVAEFSIYDRSTIVYTTLMQPDGKHSVGYYEDGADTAHAIRTYADDGQVPLHVALGKYFGDMYEAVAYGDTVELLKGDLPKSTNPNPSSLHTVAKMTVPGSTQYLDIKTDGRFLVAQNGATYHVYDLELKKETATVLKGSAVVASELQWLDGYTASSDRDGVLRLYEFDGANQHDIMSVVPGFSATLSPNDKYLYGINKSADGTYHLERVQLILS